MRATKHTLLATADMKAGNKTRKQWENASLSVMDANGTATIEYDHLLRATTVEFQPFENCHRFASRRSCFYAKARIF